MAIVVDEPTINSPFTEPARRYRMRGGRPDLADSRRPSGFTPGLRTRGEVDPTWVNLGERGAGRSTTGAPLGAPGQLALREAPFPA